MSKDVKVSSPLGTFIMAGWVFRVDQVKTLLVALDYSKEVLPTKDYKELYSKLLKYKIDLETLDE